MTEAILELKHLGKSFDARQVLKDIDLNIHRGRVVALLGKNGAGKTTLIAVNLAVFGITSFISSLQVRTAVQAILGILLLAALGITAQLMPASFFSLASVLLAMGLLWASHSLLCNAEMN